MTNRFDEAVGSSMGKGLSGQDVTVFPLTLIAVSDSLNWEGQLRPRQDALRQADSLSYDVAATSASTPTFTCRVWVRKPSLEIGAPEVPEGEIHCWSTPNADRSQYQTLTQPQ